MAEAVAKVRNATPGKEATARSGARNGRSKRSAAKSSMDEGFRFTCGGGNLGCLPGHFQGGFLPAFFKKTAR